MMTWGSWSVVSPTQSPEEPDKLRLEKVFTGGSSFIHTISELHDPRQQPVVAHR